MGPETDMFFSGCASTHLAGLRLADQLLLRDAQVPAELLPSGEVIVVRSEVLVPFLLYVLLVPLLLLLRGHCVVFLRPDPDREVYMGYHLG